ncbi:MAG TPA: hypothetical protein PKA77_16955 [Chitinophagaceae bacterium]|nr:hypothetical protein [Chitinophagaceae bacterium]
MELAITTASFAPKVNVPELLIVCAEEPLKFIVPADAGLKFNVAPLATEILPFIECPGVLVRLQLNVVFVPIDKLPFIINAEVPVPVIAGITPDVLMNVTFPKVLPENEVEGVRVDDPLNSQLLLAAKDEAPITRANELVEFMTKVLPLLKVTNPALIGFAENPCNKMVTPEGTETAVVLPAYVAPDNIVIVLPLATTPIGAETAGTQAEPFHVSQFVVASRYTVDAVLTL